MMLKDARRIYVPDIFFLAVFISTFDHGNFMYIGNLLLLLYFHLFNLLPLLISLLIPLLLSLFFLLLAFLLLLLPVVN